MVSDWMEHGTIMDFITVYPETNRLKLVNIIAQSPKPKTHTNLNPPSKLTDVARGLEYLHDWPSVHADLKSVGWVLWAF